MLGKIHSYTSLIRYLGVGLREMNMNGFTLAFKDGSEKKFKGDYLLGSLVFNRISILGSILYIAAFAFLDFITLPEVSDKLFFIRFVIVCPIVFIVFLTSFTKFYHEYWQFLTSLATLVAGISIVVMTVISPELGRYYYYVGTILVLIYCYMLLRLRFIWASLTGFIIVASYIISLVLFPGVDPKVATINIFFQVSANFIGMFGSYFLEYFYRKDYFHRILLRNAEEEIIHANVELEEKVREKTKELQADLYLKKKAEKELIKARILAEQSDYLKTAFLQNMSHEIRTPLNAICGFSGILSEPDLDDEFKYSYISIIQQSSNQLLSIVTDVLTISSLEANHVQISREKFCVNKMIKDMYLVHIKQAEDRKLELKLVLSVSDAQSEIYTDKLKVTQVLSNLITNALMFTKEGYIEFGYHIKSNEVEFFVKDTGVGIADNMLDNVFKRFRQVDASSERLVGGNGLGLSISKGFVELLNGDIWVHSELGKGSMFFFSIPNYDGNED